MLSRRDSTLTRNLLMKIEQPSHIGDGEKEGKIHG